MILSAVALWKKLDTDNPLQESEYNLREDADAGMTFSEVTYAGRRAEDGCVRVYARFGRPSSGEKFPAVLLLPDAGEAADEELLYYFIDKGYAVLMPDYAGKTPATENSPHTVYPPSLSYADYGDGSAPDEVKTSAAETRWFEWISVALYSVKYLKGRSDVSGIGVIGIRTGGEIAWKVMLSPDVKCGVPINAAGWLSYRGIGKFGDNGALNMSDERHAYIAGIESQSYAPFVRCPVLMLCALRDGRFDYDRAYDTYSRVGISDGSAIVYSADSGSCIGPMGLKDLDLFLERNLKGREIFIPGPLNIALRFENGVLSADVEGDEGGIVEETGVYYAEAAENTPSVFRSWQRVYRTDGKGVEKGCFSCTLPYYEGAAAAFAYAYARYINGFTLVSKIAAKKFPSPSPDAVKSRIICTGQDVEGMSVAHYDDYSVAGIFLEEDAVPKLSVGYGGLKGAYSVGGIMTCKISSPRYIPDENAMLEFDVYARQTLQLKVSVDVADGENAAERFSDFVEVRGGGKWKRVILSAGDFKSEFVGRPLESFARGQALAFDCEDEESVYALANILWL